MNCVFSKKTLPGIRLYAFDNGDTYLISGFEHKTGCRGLTDGHGGIHGMEGSPEKSCERIYRHLRGMFLEVRDKKIAMLIE